MFILRTVVVFLIGMGWDRSAAAQSIAEGDAIHGKAIFAQSCSLCHADTTGAGGAAIAKLGPSLVGVFRRKAATAPGFNYTAALSGSGLTWDVQSLDRFLTNPAAAVPGTVMPMAIADAKDRADIIAYLKTLQAPAVSPAPAAPVVSDSNDWHHNQPGRKYHLAVSGLPPIFDTPSAGNGPKVVKKPEDAIPAAPPGFTVSLVASGFRNGRLLQVAPNGDIFMAETGGNQIHVLRLPDGTVAPSENQVFAEGLDRPFGIAFYPPGEDPKWVYVANNNSIVRFAYRNGDLHAEGAPEVIVPRIIGSGGGHSTRNIAFSHDGQRLFIAVGSESNVAERMGQKSPDEIKAWEAGHGLGAAWGNETNRADVLVTDPEGKTPLRAFATGIRNPVGLALNPETGDVWVSTNERDGLGDNLVPDYASRIKDGAYYGWPWYYLGDHVDPRRKGERPDLAGKALVPDVLLQAHSAALELAFYPMDTAGVAAFPAEYRGDAFVALHGSWNRRSRTGYKIIRVRLDHGVPTGEYEDFLTGFVMNDQAVWGRPVGVAVAHDGALLVSEDGNNTLWRIGPPAKVGVDNAKLRK